MVDSRVYILHVGEEEQIIRLIFCNFIKENVQNYDSKKSKSKKNIYNYATNSKKQQHFKTRLRITRSGAAIAAMFSNCVCWAIPKINQRQP